MLNEATSQRDQISSTAATSATRCSPRRASAPRAWSRRRSRRRRPILEELGRERGLLERKIEELRGFERDYRSRLHSYIQGQLAELKNTVSRVTLSAEEQGEVAAEPQPERQS